MAPEAIQEKLKKIESHTGRFTGMQVLTILTIVSGIVMGYADRDKNTTVDNTKQLNSISLTLNTLRDSLTLFKVQISNKMESNHDKTTSEIEAMKARIKIIEYHSSGLATEQYKNGKLTFNHINQ